MKYSSFVFVKTLCQKQSLLGSIDQFNILGYLNGQTNVIFGFQCVEYLRKHQSQT